MSYPVKTCLEITLFNFLWAKVQCDAIKWEQLENLHILRGYNFWTNGLIFILKTSFRPYLYRAKVIIGSDLV